MQITVGTTEKEAGETFTVDVTLKDVPAGGIQCVDFAISYDNKVISIDKVTAGKITETGAAGSDGTSSAAPLFDAQINKGEGVVGILWSTALDDASYWIKSDGVLCTISGTVLDGVADGSKSDLKIVASGRETYVGSGVKNTNVSVGYSKDGTPVRYDVTKNDGLVTVGKTEPTTQKVKATKRGDANCDTNVNMADAVLIMQSIANGDEYGLGKPDGITEIGQANADVTDADGGKGGDGVTMLDAQRIQEYSLELVSEV